MSQSLAKVLAHIVYSTKRRQRWLEDFALRSELCAYNAAVLKQDVDSPAILVGGVADKRSHTRGFQHSPLDDLPLRLLIGVE